MFMYCNLAVLILVLTLHDQVHTGEIIGGKKAAPHSRPYMVLLELHKSNGQTSQCDGFLVKKNFVMTAAHCEASSYKVFLGLHNSKKKNNKRIQHETVPGTNAFPHKFYNRNGLSNDIMLLKLCTKAKFNKNVKRINLTGHDDGSVPKSCQVSGWGITKKNKLSPKLREANVTLIENELCASQNKYCSDGESGPSDGDSGGPLVCEDGKAYGVISGRMIKPDGSKMYSYTKISEYKDWIDSVIKHNHKC